MSFCLKTGWKQLASLISVVALLSLLTAMWPNGETSVFATTPSQSELSIGTNQTYLPILMNRYDTTLGTPIFGVQTYGNTLPSNKYFEHMIDSGTTWVRVPVMWRSAEPERLDPPKQYNWSSIDNALSAARADRGNLKIVATITHAPEWAAPGIKAPIYDHALDDFVMFVEALVRRYNGDGIDDAPGSPVVTHWEFYNEPDAGERPGDLRWGESGDQYANMLAAVYPAVKAANPQAQVVFGGLAYDWFQDQGGPFVREFLDDVLAAGGGNYFDIMNFHSYPAFSSNWTGQMGTNGPGLLEKANFIRNKMENEYGVFKPMINTEAGWRSNSTPTSPSNEDIQARYVVQLFAQSYAANLDLMIWWMLYDPGGGYQDYGLVTRDDEPVRKLSFTVYQNMVEEMSTTHFTRRLPLAETGHERMEVYQFNDWVKQRTLYVAWLNPVNGNQTQPLQLPTAVATIKSMEGNVIGVVADGDDGIIDGYVTIDVGSRPIYIEANH